MRTLGRMRGRPCTQPFLVEIKKGGSRLSPQRYFSFAPLGKSIAPSSVTFGDSFPPRGSLRRWYTPATKYFLNYPPLPQNANPNQGTYMGHETAQPPPRCAPPRQNQRVGTSGHKTGGPGGLPPALFLPISREKWGPPPGRRAPRGAAPRGTGKAPTTQRVRSTPPRPRPGPGGNPRRRVHPAPVPTRPPYQGQPGKTKPPGLGIREGPRPGGSDIERENSKQGTGNLPCPARFMRLLLAWCSRC